MSSAAQEYTVAVCPGHSSSCVGLLHCSLTVVNAGALLSFPNASAQSVPAGLAQPGGTQPFASMRLEPQIASAPMPPSQDGAPVLVPGSSQGKNGLARSTSASSSSSRSTEILNHLLDLKQQAEQANTAIDPHDVQVCKSSPHTPLCLQAAPGLPRGRLAGGWQDAHTQ